jgi:hypothetical protein
VKKERNRKRECVYEERECLKRYEERERVEERSKRQLRKREREKRD